MLCHRSWNAENTTPSLAIYDDRIVFQNPGAFPLGMTWQDFVNDQIGSLPANPTIANVFYRRGTMKAWGRGLIMESCTEQGPPALPRNQSYLSVCESYNMVQTITD